MVKTLRRWCTVPKIFGFREWFETRFGCDCCKMHDAYYIEIWRHWRKGVKPPITRLEADNILFECMVAKDKKYHLLAIITWLHLRINYWPYKIITSFLLGCYNTIREVLLFLKFMLKG